MIGLLFHGPEVFDSRWAQKIITAIKKIDSVKCVLAGAMGRTAVIDSGLENIEFWDEMPSRCLSRMALKLKNIIVVNYGKTVHSGLTFGNMIIERAGLKTPILQIECSHPCFVEWNDNNNPVIISILQKMGVTQKKPQKQFDTTSPSVWKENEKTYRKITTANINDFILVDGIIVGTALKTEIVLISKGKHLIEIQGAQIKEHGIEKLERFGGINLETVKLTTSSFLRGIEHIPRTKKTNGTKITFIDHAGMYVYNLINDTKGVVTVGDDTTSIVGDIMYRFQIPVIGIIDGDEDIIHKKAHITAGSMKLTVKADDIFGLKVFREIFNNKKNIEMDFKDLKDQIIKIAKKDLVKIQHY